ncbi:hypothetical protein ACFSO7_08445 [Bacillus sp. CGMCC 1.16607]|uniref:hypothetical protein n=1 Tax=Bacillus sp. CGMCC 1.16607 TaxID=3351842 RepID=UPI00363642F8
MRKAVLIQLTTILLLALSTGVYATKTVPKKVLLIERNEDITGDGISEKIIIKGVPFQDNDIFKEFQLTIKLSNNKVIKEELEYGVEPKIYLIDLNHDRIKDVFISLPTVQSGEEGNQYLYSAKDFKINKINVPDLLEIDGQFTDEYKAKISIPATNKHLVFDLINRKEKYDSLGMYQNSKLNEPFELMISPTGEIKPISTEGNGNLLKCTQRICGTSKSDTIALVESTWKYKKGDWQLVAAEVKEMNN